MDIAGYAIRHSAVTLVVTVLVTLGGLLSYGTLGQLEDPAFTIKTAVISTAYPGATAAEVEQEVTERIETAVQWIKPLDEVRSISQPGLSIVYIDIEDTYRGQPLKQVWDEVRRKIGEVERSLPPGCGAPLVNDDFGDVFGIYYAIRGDGYSPRELRQVADDLRRELLLCDQVGRIDFSGTRTDVVRIEMDRARMAQLGIGASTIFQAIEAHNAVQSAGDVAVGEENLRLRVSGGSRSVEELGELLVGGGDGRLIRVSDVASIERGYIDPPRQIIRRNGEPAVGLGISVIDGGNVVIMGEAVKARLAELAERLPVGISVEPISFQPDLVSEAVDGFIWNLGAALAIVIALLVVFMGAREGIVIGAILLLTVLGTFIGMSYFEVNLQRISLGALVIALGMLVDNAIVITEGIAIKLRQGRTREQAASEAAAETQWPLLGATVIAILAFAAISVSRDVTGEFLGSLFQVIALSLGLSWVFALTVCPWLCVKLLPEVKAVSEDVYGNRFFRVFRRVLAFCVDHRWLCLGTTVVLFLVARQGFNYLPRNFFPDATRPQFKVEAWFPEGTHIARTDAYLAEMAEYIDGIDGCTDITSFAGAGALRFTLTYDPSSPSSAYGVLLVDVDDYTRIVDEIVPQVQRHFEERYPQAVIKAVPFVFGPPTPAVEARIVGPEGAVLRELAAEVAAIMRVHPNARAVRHDWGERVKVAQLRFAEERAREAAVTRNDVARVLEMNFDGAVTGLFREGSDLLPILLQPPREESDGIGDLVDVQVWSSLGRHVLPLEQVSDGVEVAWEDAAIRRRDRKRTITVGAQQRRGTADDLFRAVRADIEALPMPDGYELEWGGEFEKSAEANGKLMANVPFTMMLMFIISVMLFNTLRHPIVIFLGLPLAMIGVSAGLLIAHLPFNFTSTLGFLSLIGMLIKNEIVLLEQVNIEAAAGKDAYNGLLDATVSRVRPVAMAAFTTVLGMIPLLWDAFFASMAVTIMGGLTFATVMTLVVVPALYAALFRVKKHARSIVAEAVKHPPEKSRSQPRPQSEEEG